jgi:phenylacetic acid degradation operon negative regulatory protein
MCFIKWHKVYHNDAKKSQRARMASASTHWIQAAWEFSRPKSKSLIITLFGDAVAPRGGAMRLGDLVSVLGHFGVKERSVRTCVFRLAREGWIVAQRQGRRSAYSLTPSGMLQFQRAYRRVYSEPYRQWDGSWTLVCLPNDPSSGHIWQKLARELVWEGFGKVAPNVYGHPSPGLASLRELLEGPIVSSEVFVLSARSLDIFPTLPLRNLIDRSWNLENLANGYREFTERFSIFANSHAAPNLTPAESFIVRTLLIHWFRRVTLHDPQIPPELLPSDWPGRIAYELCRRVYQQVYRDAESFLSQTVGASGGSLAEVSLWFYQRFGGLT